VHDFITYYNAEWLIEKNGNLSLHAIRQKWNPEHMRMAA